MELKKITDNDLIGKGVLNMPNTPNLTPIELQYKVEEVVRDVVIPTVNLNIDNTPSRDEMYRLIDDRGGGDMMKSQYDSNKDGVVNAADFANNADTLDGKHANELYMLTGGTEIPEGADLNTYTVVGNYENRNSLNTIGNIPIKDVFFLKVQEMVAADGEKIINQTIQYVSRSVIYTRRLRLGSWTAWDPVGAIWEKIWENASPGSRFVSQSIVENISKYSHVVAIYNRSIDEPYQFSVIIQLNKTGQFNEFSNGSGKYRLVIMNPNGVIIDNAYFYEYYGSTNKILSNDILIPIAFYGIKGVINV